MPVPTPPRGDPLDDAIIAWADASARLAQALRCNRTTQPQLTLVPQQQIRAGHLIAAFAAAYWIWLKVYHCACQWNLAYLVHPNFSPYWCYPVAVSIAWQLCDRVKSGHPGNASRAPRELAAQLAHRRTCEPSQMSSSLLLP